MSGRAVPLASGDYEALLRQHCVRGEDWAYSAVTDYWLTPAASTGPLASSQGEILSEHGWTTTSLAGASGSAADFMTASDVGTPGEFTQNAQNDLIKSPAIFGDYVHARSAMMLLGRKILPLYIIVDMVARFSVVANDEPTTALGMVEDGGSIVTAADHLGAFTSNSATWGLSANGSEGTAFGTADTEVHRFRLVFDRISGYVYPGVDGTMYDGSGSSVQGRIAITADELPMAFGAGSGGANNLVQLNQVHVFYAYKIPQFV